MNELTHRFEIGLYSCGPVIIFYKSIAIGTQPGRKATRKYFLLQQTCQCMRRAYFQGFKVLNCNRTDSFLLRIVAYLKELWMMFVTTYKCAVAEGFSSINTFKTYTNFNLIKGCGKNTHVYLVFLLFQFHRFRNLLIIEVYDGKFPFVIFFTPYCISSRVAMKILQRFLVGLVKES